MRSTSISPESFMILLSIQTCDTRTAERLFARDRAGRERPVMPLSRPGAL